MPAALEETGSMLPSTGMNRFVQQRVCRESPVKGDKMP